MSQSRIMKSIFYRVIVLFFCSTLTFTGQMDFAHADEPVVIKGKAKKKAKGKLKRIEQIEFRDVSVGDALRILAEQTDMNFMASKKASDVRVTMFLKKVKPIEVLDAIAKTYNLWYRMDQKSNIIRIYTVNEYRLEQVEFKNEITEIFTLKNAKNSLDLADTIQNLYGERVKLSFGQNQDELATEISKRFERFELIGEGGGGSGVGSNQDSRNGSNRNAFGQTNRRNNRRIEGSEFDDMIQSSRGVLGDSSKKDDAPGVLLGDMEQSREFLTDAIKHQVPIFVGVIKRQNRVLVRTRDSDAMDAIRDLFNELDKESSMLLLEVRVLQIDLSDGFDSLFDFKLKSGNAQLSTLKAHPSDPDNASNFVKNALKTSAAVFEPALLASLVSEGFEARIELLEKEKRITTLSTQMLMTTNQEVSRIFVGQQRPITTGFTSSIHEFENRDGGTSTSTITRIIPVTTTQAIGTTLLLTPNINADKTVSLRLLISQSNFLEKGATIPLSSGLGLEEAEVDVVNERVFSGTVVAENETSIAIGGLISEKSGDSETKVPILGDIPLLGFFFREEADTRSREEIVVIIKPHIISAPQKAESISNTFLQKNSIHPKAIDSDATLDMYKNDRRDPNGYDLQDEYKLYDEQDHFDPYHKKGDLNKPERLPQNQKHVQKKSPVKKQLTATQQIYVELSKYAAKAVKIPAHEREVVENIEPEAVNYHEKVELFHDERVRVVPVAGWRRGGVHVTALEVHNYSYDKVNLDYRQIKGRWLASSVEHEVLEKMGVPGDTTYMYLISAESFDESYERIKVSQQ